METELIAGIKLFNRGAFFEAHEILEQVWRAAPVAYKAVLQGIVQVAVALHHHSTGNQVGAASVLAKARRNLALCPPDFQLIDVRALRASLDGWQRALAEHRTPPPLPQIFILRPGAESR